MTSETPAQNDPLESPQPHVTPELTEHAESSAPPAPVISGPRVEGDVVIYSSGVEVPRCTATSKQNQRRCKRAATPGTTVCRNHGSAAPQVRAKAARRLAELHDPTIKAALEIIEDKTVSASTRVKMIDSVLDRIGYPRQKELALEDMRQKLVDRLEQVIDVEVIDVEPSPEDEDDPPAAAVAA